MRASRGKLSKRDVEALKEVRRLITFERAAFDKIHPDKDDQLPKTEKEVTEFIKRRTRLYFQSWVLPVIDEMIGRE